MKTLRLLGIVAAVALCAYPVIAHHPAASIVDEEIYEQINEMVSTTPHGDMDFDSTGGMTTIDITGRVTDLELIVEQDFLSYVALLDGDVTLTIEFTGNRTADIHIIQDETPAPDDSPEVSDKAAFDDESAEFGEVKTWYR